MTTMLMTGEAGTTLGPATEIEIATATTGIGTKCGRIMTTVGTRTGTTTGITIMTGAS
jgi:hypothetical protein